MNFVWPGCLKNVQLYRILSPFSYQYNILCTRYFILVRIFLYNLSPCFPPLFLGLSCTSKSKFKSGITIKTPSNFCCLIDNKCCTILFNIYPFGLPLKAFLLFHKFARYSNYLLKIACT